MVVFAARSSLLHYARHEQAFLGLEPGLVIQSIEPQYLMC
jgi:hypothetical protein